MPKKIPPNPKSVEAKARKEAVAADRKQAEAKAKEDALWADQGAKSKAAKKKEEDERKRQETLAKKAEARRLEEEEAKQLEKISGKGAVRPAGIGRGGGGGGGAAAAASPAKGSKSPGDGVSKVTQAQLLKMKEEEEQKRREEEERQRRRAARTADVAEYERMLNVANTNRVEADGLDARNLDEAIGQLANVGLEEQTTPDKHPEKRVRAAYKAYEEAELARLRAERPGLTLTQYKEQVWKSWKKSPLNPLNQTPTK